MLPAISRLEWWYLTSKPKHQTLTIFTKHLGKITEVTASSDSAEVEILELEDSLFGAEVVPLGLQSAPTTSPNNTTQTNGRNVVSWWRKFNFRWICEDVSCPFKRSLEKVKEYVDKATPSRVLRTLAKAGMPVSVITSVRVEQKLHVWSSLCEEWQSWGYCGKRSLNS